MVVFLDDMREPTMVPGYACFKNDIYDSNKEEIVVVKNFSEFKNVIETRFKEITAISFDHDLGKDHYIDKKYWGKYDESKDIQNIKFSSERNGVDCARLFMNTYLDVYGEVPFENIIVNIHSANPVGADNIYSIFHSYIRLFGGNKNNIEVYYEDVNKVKKPNYKRFEGELCNIGGCVGIFVNDKCDTCGC